MQNQIISIQEDCLKLISKAKSQEELLDIEKQFIGKKGQLADILKNIINLDAKDKQTVGKQANLSKNTIQQALIKQRNQLENQDLADRLAQEQIDVTLPASLPNTAKINPLRQLQKQAEEIFESLGFAIADGPHIESELYNFDSLNFKKHHPARDIQDTFFIDKPEDSQHGHLVLRTHTSPVQIRSMLKDGAPIRIVIPGRVFRNEEQDATHEHTFYQIEGLLVDKNISIAHLRGTLEEFLSQLFQKQITTRLRPGYFPFTEPSLELDMSCVFCDQQGCKICKDTGFIELLGCGMVHPNVLTASNLDPQEYQGFAFGAGLDRILMLKMGMQSIRDIRKNDLRFLKQL